MIRVVCKCGKNCQVVHKCMTTGKYKWEFCKSQAVPGEGPGKSVLRCSNLDADICISFWILSKSLQFWIPGLCKVWDLSSQAGRLCLQQGEVYYFKNQSISHKNAGFLFSLKTGKSGMLGLHPCLAVIRWPQATGVTTLRRKALWVHLCDRGCPRTRVERGFLFCKGFLFPCFSTLSFPSNPSHPYTCTRKYVSRKCTQE